MLLGIGFFNHSHSVSKELKQKLYGFVIVRRDILDTKLCANEGIRHWTWRSWSVMGGCRSGAASVTLSMDSSPKGSFHLILFRKVFFRSRLSASKPFSLSRGKALELYTWEDILAISLTLCHRQKDSYVVFSFSLKIKWNML